MIALLGRHFTFDTYGHVLKRAKHEAALFTGVADVLVHTDSDR